MTWQAHDPHPSTRESRPFYTYTVTNPQGEDNYAAFITEISLDGQTMYRATVPKVETPPRGKAAPPNWYYTHDSLQEAKDWCVVELVKRRLDV